MKIFETEVEGPTNPKMPVQGNSSYLYEEVPPRCLPCSMFTNVSVHELIAPC